MNAFLEACHEVKNVTASDLFTLTFIAYIVGAFCGGIADTICKWVYKKIKKRSNNDDQSKSKS